MSKFCSWVASNNSTSPNTSYQAMYGLIQDVYFIRLVCKM